MAKDKNLSNNEIELLLEQHKELQESIRMQIRQNNQRVLSGIAGIAAVAGASLLRNGEWLFVLVPFIFGIIFIQIVNKNRYIALNAIHSIEIENELTKIAPLFCKELKYGGFFGNEPVALKESPHRWASWHTLLSYGVVPILIPTYIFTVIISVRFWNNRPDELIFLSDSVLLTIYILFTLYIISIGGIGWWHLQKLSNIIDNKHNNE